MHSSMQKVVAASAAAALTALGAVAASAAESDAKPGEWQSYNDTIVFPKGTACKHRVVAEDKGEIRETVLEDGTMKVEYAHWSNAKFTSSKQHKSYSVNSGGGLTIKPLDKNGDTVKIQTQGRVWGQGKGLKGILAGKGTVRVTRIHNNDPQRAEYTDLDLTDVAELVQVCYKVGSKPVWGRNVVPS